MSQWFDCFTGTNFGIAIKHYLDDDVTQKMKAIMNTGTSYYHSIITSNNDEIKKQQNELHLSDGGSEFYTGKSCCSSFQLSSECICSFTLIIF